MIQQVAPSVTDPVAKSLYDLLLTNSPLMTPDGKALPKTVTLTTFGNRVGIPISCDNGNYRAKFVVQDAKENKLVTNAVIVATGPASHARTKVARTTYRVRNMNSQVGFSQEFLIGRSALEHCDAESLSLGVGATEERLTPMDTRQLNFLLASTAESLLQAHYPPNATYYLVMGFAAPNEEFELGSFRDSSAAALELLDQQSFEIERIRQDGKERKVEKFVLFFAESIPTPQTAGGWTALNYSLDGKLIPSRLVEETLVDFGGGHTQYYRVRRVRNDQGGLDLVGTGGRLGVGKGSINIARVFSEAMREKYSNLSISDITSQVAIADGSIVIHGQRRPLDEVMDMTLLEEATERLLVDVLQILQQDSSQVGFLGGGLENQMLYELLQRRTERRKDGLFFVDRSLTSMLNSYGTYFAALLDSTNRHREYAG